MYGVHIAVGTLRSGHEGHGNSSKKQVGFSQAKISRIEKGVNIPTPEDVEALAKTYRAASDTRRHLVSLAEDVKAANRRVVLSRRANRAEFQARIGRIEAVSEQLREFSPIIVPGLLQTVEYMRAIFTAGGISPSEVADAVARRLERQAVLGQPGRRITVITTEGALGWAADEPNMMLRQLEHIRVVAIKPGVRVGIIPCGVPSSRLATTTSSMSAQSCRGSSGPKSSWSTPTCRHTWISTSSWSSTPCSAKPPTRSSPRPAIATEICDQRRSQTRTDRLSDLLFILCRVANPDGDILWKPGGGRREI